MKIRSGAAATLAGALLSAGLMTAPATADETCRSRAEVRGMVADLVAEIRDDVRSRPARAATRLALVESMRTFGGDRATTARERRALGQEIAALARRQSETQNRVEGRALATAIQALTEQRERGGTFTAQERKELRGDIAALRRALVQRADSRAEARRIATAVRALVQQFTCTSG